MKLLLVSLFVVLGGCSTATIVGKSAGFVVSKYCSIPPVGRKVVREVVGNQIEPNTMQIECNI